MKRFTLAMVALLTVAVTGYAQQSNLVQNINIHLLGLKQGGTSTNRSIISTDVDFVRVSSRQVVVALGAATGNSFSWGARLVLVSPLDSGDRHVEVRDGDKKVDVTGFFSIEPVSDSVQRSELNTRTGRYFANDYFIERFALHNNEGSAVGLHFDVRGFAIETSSNGIDRQPGGNLRLDAAGSGDRNGVLLILQGFISVTDGALEEAEGGGGPIES
jgi:hypothetical protein